MTRAAAVGPKLKSDDSSSSSAPARSKPLPPDSYFRRTELPLTSLAFLLPLILMYEVGTWLWVTNPHSQVEQRIIAFNMLQRFLSAFGASAKYLPAFAVPAILLTAHVFRKDKWKVKPAHLLGMALESLVLAIPLMLIARASEQYLSHITLAAAPSVLDKLASAKGLYVLSLGAGVYEELLFRLIAFSVLSFVFSDLLELRKPTAALLMVAASAILFSCYHYLGSEPFRFWTFAFRTLAGGYFGIVYLCRGFGVTAGSHVAYDVCAISMRVFA